jgi:hypothetical protein
MKEGVKVKVVAQLSGHEFDIGEVVERKYSCEDSESCIGFYSEQNGIWYMSGDEYEICSKHYVVSLLLDAMVACDQAGFSDRVFEAISQAQITAYSEAKDDL